jgi:hypothetical protein
MKKRQRWKQCVFQPRLAEKEQIPPRAFRESMVLPPCWFFFLNFWLPEL